VANNKETFCTTDPFGQPRRPDKSTHTDATTPALDDSQLSSIARLRDY
jgi:hypothetical protein